MALYHKHRPQLFATIIGQEPIVRTLSNEITMNRLAHAYLFSGPRGVGKTTTARVLAKAINCRERQPAEYEPCDRCQSCQEISGSRSIDVIEMDAASHTGVDNVRENIIDTAHFRPTASPYKIFIIDEVHMLSTSAFNALLKTLEEPPAHVIFVLATTDPEKLPATIISRCQRFSFKKIPPEIMKRHLDRIAEDEGVHIAAEVMQKIIRKSDGCARDAVSLLDQVLATGEKHITPEVASLILPTSHIEDVLAYVSGLIQRDQAVALGALATVSATGMNVPQFAADTLDLLRVILMRKLDREAVSATFELSSEALKTIDELNTKCAPPELVRLIDLVMKRRLEIKSSPLPELPLELAAVEWCLGGRLEESQIKEKKTEWPASEPEKKTMVERVKELVTGKEEVLISLEEAQSAWSALVKSCEEASPSLVSILKMANLKSVDGTAIQLLVPYAFHRDKLLERACERKILDILCATLGQRVKLEIQVEEKSQIVDPDIQNMAALFGGEIVPQA